MVLMVKVEVAEPLVPGVTEEGDAEQVVSAGRPLQPSETAKLYPDPVLTVTVTLVLFPATTVAEVGLKVKPKSAPAPVSVTDCGLLAALSVTVKLPGRVPNAEGVNTTLIVQEAPAARLVPQLLVWVKSPLAAMLVMLMLAVPEFVSVTGWEALLDPRAWPEKVSVEGEKLATGPPWPVPSSATVWVLPAVPLLLSVTVSDP